MRFLIELGPQTLQLIRDLLGVKQSAQKTVCGKPHIEPIPPPMPSPDMAHLEAQLEELKELVRSMRTTVVEKEFYSVEEVAERTIREGVTKYTKFTIRQACNLGRIPGAKKSQSGRHWLIPYQAVVQILNEGLPPPSLQSTKKR